MLMKNWHMIYKSITPENTYIKNVVMKSRFKVIGDKSIKLDPIDPNFNIKNYTVYSMVRNPYDRFVSAVKFKNFGDRKKISDEVLNSLIEDELSKIEENSNYLKIGGGDLDDNLHIVIVPQCYWLGENVKLLKYENLDDWKVICDITGTPIDTIHIKSGYSISEEQKRRIKKAYYEYDKEVFDFYGL